MSCVILKFSLTACMLAEQLNIPEMGLPLQCYAFTKLKNIVSGKSVTAVITELLLKEALQEC